MGEDDDPVNLTDPADTHSYDSIMDTLGEYTYQLATHANYFDHQKSPRARRIRQILNRLSSHVQHGNNDKKLDAKTYPNDPITSLFPYESDDDMDDTDKTSERRTKVDKILSRLGELCDMTHLPPLTAAEFSSEILLARSPTVEDAIVQLFRGYSKWSEADLQLVKPQFADPSTPAKQRALHEILCNHHPKEGSETITYLVALNQNMERNKNSMLSGTLIQTLRDNITALDFGRLWTREASGEGSKARLVAYYHGAYQASRPEFDGLNEDGAAMLMKDRIHRSQFKKFKLEHAKDVGARNRLWRLFDAVGYSVLVDPYWEVAMLRKGARAQAAWTYTHAILARIKELDLPQERYRYTFNNFYRLVKEIDEDTANGLNFFRLSLN